MDLSAAAEVKWLTLHVHKPSQPDFAGAADRPTDRGDEAERLKICAAALSRTAGSGQPAASCGCHRTGQPAVPLFGAHLTMGCQLALRSPLATG